MALRSTLLLFLGLTLTTDVQSDVTEDWNAAFIQAVRLETPPPCLVSRNLPILHVAIYRAVQAAAAAGLDESSQRVTALEAGDRVFKIFFPSQAKIAATVAERHRVDLAPEAKAQCLTLAAAAAKRTLEERENDGSSTTVHYVPSDKPGQWRRTPPNFRPPELPHWSAVKPWVIADPKSFLPPPPPALDSAEYAKELEAVRELGGKKSGTRTAEQTLIAHFWSDFSYTTSPPGHWNDIARDVCRQKRLTTLETTRIFAVLNVALADACVAVWHCKYHYNLWRPVTAIHRADEDGLTATLPDKTWEPLLVTPPHPEYVSGHSGASGAAAAVLEHFFGKDGISFSAASDDVQDVTRSFTSFDSCAQEVAMSRLYGGIHYPMAGTEGLKLGRRVASTVIAQFDKALK